MRNWRRKTMIKLEKVEDGTVRLSADYMVIDEEAK